VVTFFKCEGHTKSHSLG